MARPLESYLRLPKLHISRILLDLAINQKFKSLWLPDENAICTLGWPQRNGKFCDSGYMQMPLETETFFSGFLGWVKYGKWYKFIRDFVY